MSCTRRLITVLLCAAVVGTVIIPAFIRGDPPAAQKAQAGRDMDVISAELKVAGDAFHEIVPTVKDLGSPTFRKDNAAKAIPAAKKVAELLNEIATSHPEAEGAMDGRYRYLASAVALGDKESADILIAASASKDPHDALSAKSFLTFGQWVAASEDAKAQTKILDDYLVLAKASPKDDQIAVTLKIMSQLGAANPDLSHKALDIIQNTLTGELAQEMSTQLAVLDKPFTVTGRTTTNAKFTSADLKGKVVMLDLWATWCIPCRERMPEVKKLYHTYHDKGLEIIGVNFDDSDDKPIDFAKENDMPWIELRELTQTETDNVHPLGKKFGIEGIPTVVLIDKKGILRFIDEGSQEDTEARVKKLLAEPDGETAKLAPAPAK